MKRIRVLLVDDEPTVRRGLRMRLQLEPDIEVVGEAGSGPDAGELSRKLRPDVVLMDVDMPDGDGIEAGAALREELPGTAVIVLTMYDDTPTRDRADAAGLHAFVSKHLVDTLLLSTIRAMGRRQGRGER